MDLLFALALLAIVLGISIELSIGLRKLTHLEDIPPLPLGKTPKISIIIPALNEEETIEPALASVLSLDYKNLEIIVVN
ncbi:MAG: glycosyltransferase, partial [Desulfobulbaceae bacterium]|nr:glycosyltransferase [Desulfobulbaceae bacterium]